MQSFFIFILVTWPGLKRAPVAEIRYHISGMSFIFWRNS